jgi:sporulation protein YlmC with PRC-barrel domain
MTARYPAGLHTIEEDSLEFVTPGDDVRGRSVVDSLGEHIGRVDALIVDDANHQARFLRIRAGGLLGRGGTRYLVPVDSIYAIDEHAVHVDQTQAHVTNGPVYDPQLMENLDAVLDHYGAQRH